MTVTQPLSGGIDRHRPVTTARRRRDDDHRRCVTRGVGEDRSGARAAAVDAVAGLLTGGVTTAKLGEATAAIAAAPGVMTAHGGARIDLALLSDLHARAASFDERVPAAAERLCPHCLAVLDAHAVSQSVRCPTCRLLVAAGRALSAAAAAVTGRSLQASGNALSARVRRESPGTTPDPQIALRDVRRVARSLGVKTDRLRMVDYEVAYTADRGLMSLAGIFAAQTTWKAARAAAARSTPDRLDHAARPAGRLR